MDRKRAIIDAAKIGFARYGYKATTMDHVARIANVGKGTIYTFFASKEELFNIILQDLIWEMKALAIQSIDENKPFFVNLHNAVYAVLQHRTEQEMLLRLTREVKDFGTVAAQDALKQVEQAILAFIQKQLDIGITQQRVEPCDTAVVAFIIFKTYVSLLLEWDHERRALSNENIAAVFEQMFVGGLGK